MADDYPLINAQRWLSRRQRYPIIGMLPSLVKVPLGVVQVIGGLTQSAWGALSQDCIPDAAVANMLAGVMGIEYGTVNILTLGFVGFWVEGMVGAVPR